MVFFVYNSGVAANLAFEICQVKRSTVSSGRPGNRPRILGFCPTSSPLNTVAEHSDMGSEMKEHENISKLYELFFCLNSFIGLLNIFTNHILPGLSEVRVQR